MPFVVVFIWTSVGSDLPRVNEIRYLGIYIIKSLSFKCSFDQAKRAFIDRSMPYFAILAGQLLRKSLLI